MKIDAKNKKWIKILSLVLAVVLVGGIILTDSVIKEIKKSRKADPVASDLISNLVETDENTLYYER